MAEAELRPLRAAQARGEDLANAARLPISGGMLPRRTLLALLPSACAATPRQRTGPPTGAGNFLVVIAESWHTEICLPAHALVSTPLAPLRAGAPAAEAFGFGFGLESWMRADRPGLNEALEALASGPAVISVRALRDSVPPGSEEKVALGLPEAGIAAIAAFIAGNISEPVPPSMPVCAGLRLVPSSIAYSLHFTCNTWVMRALAEAGLPVPVAGIVLRRQAMAAVRAEAERQARTPRDAEGRTADHAVRGQPRP